MTEPEAAVTSNAERSPHLGAAAVFGVLLLVLTVVLGGLVMLRDRELVGPGAAPFESRSPATRSPSPPAAPVQPTALPAVTVADGVVAEWEAASPTVIPDVDVVTGDAAEGTVSMLVKAPVVTAPAAALSTAVKAAPGRYVLSFAARSLTSKPAPVAAAMLVGASRIALPPLGTSWQTVTADVEIPAAAEPVRVSLQLMNEVAALGIDDVRLVPVDGGENVVPNPSFEGVRARAGIVSQSLILRRSGAALAVHMAPGPAQWRAVDTRSERVVARGTATLRDGLSHLPLGQIPQGYYDLTVEDAKGARVSAPIAVVSHGGLGIRPDGRFGASAHLNDASNLGAPDAIASLGVGAARDDVTWRFAESSPGFYDFPDDLEDRFAQLEAQGTGILGIVNYDNGLYDGGRTPSTLDAIDAFGRYAAGIANRFDLIGLEVFNEFDNPRFNTGACGTAASCYAPLVDAVHRDVAAVHPDLPIVVGGLSAYDGTWFRELWTTGVLAKADVVSFHPYNAWENPAAIPEYIADLQSSISDAGGRPKPVWLTEFGWTTGDERGKGISEWEQAETLVRTQAMSLGAGVRRLFWYDLVNDSADPLSHEGNFGLFAQRVEGASALRPKPAAMAEALLVNALSGREAAGRDSLPSEAQSYRFGERGDRVRVAWATKGKVSAVYAATGTIRVTRIDGSVSEVEPRRGTVTIALDRSPVILSGAFEE